MTLGDTERKAKALGIRNTWKYSKNALIKAIQRKEGNFECFATAESYCDQSACCWKIDCLK